MGAKHSFGTTLTWDSVSVAGLTAINGVDVSADTVEVSNHLSADAYKEYLVGMIEPGELSVEGQFDYTDTTGQHAMLADLNGRAAKTWTITFPSATGATWTGSGFLVGFKIGDATLDNAIPFSARIKLTGKPTFAVSAVTGASACVISGAGTVIAPTFAVGTFDYVVDVANGVTEVTFTVTSTETIVLGYDGLTQSLATTVASSAVALTAGAIKTFTVTISADNKSPKVYTFRVVRAA
jgi:predicted secreted protein